MILPFLLLSGCFIIMFICWLFCLMRWRYWFYRCMNAETELANRYFLGQDR